MKHVEALFLRERAWMVFHAGEKARKAGEDFRPSRVYAPLESGHEAACEIRDGKMYLYVRHDLNARGLAETAPGLFAVFFEDFNGEVLASERRGVITYEGSSTKFPEAILDASVRPPDPEPPAPYSVRGEPRVRPRGSDRGVRG